MSMCQYVPAEWHANIIVKRVSGGESSGGVGASSLCIPEDKVGVG